MNVIICNNEYHNNTDLTGCNDSLRDNERMDDDLLKKNHKNIQPANSCQYGNESSDNLDEEGAKKNHSIIENKKIMCICGSILLKSVFTNTRKYYNEQGDEYLHIKSKWVKHTTSSKSHQIFKSILKYIFYKRRYNRLRKCVNIINKDIRYKNMIYKELNDDGVWISKKGNTNNSFIEKMKKKTREMQMKIKNKGDEPYAPIRSPC